jgi:hypothetical protein
MPGQSYLQNMAPQQWLPGLSAPQATPAPEAPGAPGAAPPSTYSPWSAVGGPGGGTRLQGTWRGSNGETMQFWGGKNFRLYGTEGRSVEGGYLQYQDRLITYIPETDVVRMYEFEYRPDMFAIRDSYGQIIVFRRGTP